MKTLLTLALAASLAGCGLIPTEAEKAANAASHARQMRYAEAVGLYRSRCPCEDRRLIFVRSDAKIPQLTIKEGKIDHIYDDATGIVHFKRNYYVDFRLSDMKTIIVRDDYFASAFQSLSDLEAHLFLWQANIDSFELPHYSEFTVARDQQGQRKVTTRLGIELVRLK